MEMIRPSPVMHDRRGDGGEVLQLPAKRSIQHRGHERLKFSLRLKLRRTDGIRFDLQRARLTRACIRGEKEKAGQNRRGPRRLYVDQLLF